MSILLTFAAAILIFCAICAVRNMMVHTERIEVLTRLGRLADEDIVNEREWRWRYDAFNKISYDEMVFKIWKPISSFYKDADFLK